MVVLTMLGVDTAALAEDLAPSYEHLKFLDGLVGDWRTEYELDGQKTEGEFHAEWAPKKYCLTWTARTRAKDDGTLLSHGSGIITWDPAENRVRELAAMSDGNLATAYFQHVDGKIVIERSGTLADGTEFTTRPVGALKADRFEFERSVWTTSDGKVLHEISPGFFQRVQKPERPPR
jgi:hypothetical protein